MQKLYKINTIAAVYCYIQNLKTYVIAAGNYTPGRILTVLSKLSSFLIGSLLSIHSVASMRNVVTQEN